MEEHEQTNERDGVSAQTEGTSSDEEARSEPSAPKEVYGKQSEDSPEQQIAALKDMLLRKAAEFENYKKRMSADTSGIIRMANEGLVLSILPIVDDLDRSLKSGKESQHESSFYVGIELIHQKLQKMLESFGVQPLETVGKPFDVHYHDALMQVPKNDVPHHTILQEVERGYTMSGKVIRHAKVVVSTSSPEAEESPADTHGKDADA